MSYVIDNLSLIRANTSSTVFDSGYIDPNTVNSYANLFYPYISDNANQSNIISLTIDIFNNQELEDDTRNLPNKNWVKEDRLRNNLSTSKDIWGFKETFHGTKKSKAISNGFCFGGQSISFYIAPQGHGAGYIDELSIWQRALSPTEVASLFTIPSPPPAVQMDRLRYWWKMTGNDIVSVADWASNTVGTVVNATLTGPSPYSFYFNNPNTPIKKLPSTQPLLNNTNFLITMWIKIPSTAGSSYFYSEDGDGNQSTGFSLASGVLQWNEYAGSYKNTTSTNTLTINTWHFVAYRKFKTTDVLYEEGIPVATNTSGWVTLGTPRSHATLGTFTYNGGDLFGFAGYISDFRIYQNYTDGTLPSDADLLTIFQAGRQ